MPEDLEVLVEIVTPDLEIAVPPRDGRVRYRPSCNNIHNKLRYTVELAATIYSAFLLREIRTYTRVKVVLSASEKVYFLLLFSNIPYRRRTIFYLDKLGSSEKFSFLPITELLVLLHCRRF